LGAQTHTYVPFVAYLRKVAPVFDASPGSRRGADATLEMSRRRMPGEFRDSHRKTMPLFCPGAVDASLIWPDIRNFKDLQTVLNFLHDKNFSGI
jgi:hypothetical protein